MYNELLPPFHQEETQELFEKVCIILEALQIDVDKTIANIKGKYNDYFKIPGELVKQVIAEFGFSYITDILSFTEEELRDFLSYLPVIHALKGHKEGLILVLDMLDIKYSIEEWWEKEPKGTPDTFTMTLDLNAGRVLPDTAQKIKFFTQKYVYPILEVFIQEYNAALFDMSIGMGGVVKQAITPGKQGKFWYMARLAGANEYGTEGACVPSWDDIGRAPYVVWRIRSKIGMAAIRKHTVNGVLTFATNRE
jgi:hypothetical protein